MTKTSGQRLLIFFALTAALGFGLHYVISWSLRRVSSGELGAFNRAMTGRVNADIVVSGSSRAFRHYDPRVLKRETGLTAFNLGRNASQIDVQLGVIKAYLHQNQKPKGLIQNLDIQSFKVTKPGEVFDPAIYVPYTGNPEVSAFLKPLVPDLRKWRYIPLYAYATEDTIFTWTIGLRALAHVEPHEPCYDGFCPMDKSWTNEFDRFKSDHPKGLEIEIEPKAVAALREIVQLCRQNQIKVVLVYSPQYHEMVGLTRNREAIFSLFSTIARENDVPFFDYTESELSYQRDLFYNAQHLNARGADKFSVDLSRRLNEVLTPGKN